MPNSAVLDNNAIQNMQALYLQHYYSSQQGEMMPFNIIPAISVLHSQLNTTVNIVAPSGGNFPNRARALKFLLSADIVGNFCLQMQVIYMDRLAPKQVGGVLANQFSLTPSIPNQFYLLDNTGITPQNGPLPDSFDQNYFGNIAYKLNDMIFEPLANNPGNFVKAVTIPWDFELNAMAMANDSSKGGLLNLSQAKFAITLACEPDINNTTNIFDQTLLFFMYDNSFAIPAAVTPSQAGNTAITFNSPANNSGVNIFSDKGANYANICPPMCDLTYLAPAELNDIIEDFYS